MARTALEKSSCDRSNRQTSAPLLPSSASDWSGGAAIAGWGSGRQPARALYLGHLTDQQSTFICKKPRTVYCQNKRKTNLREEGRREAGGVLARRGARRRDAMRLRGVRVRGGARRGGGGVLEKGGRAAAIGGARPESGIGPAAFDSARRRRPDELPSSGRTSGERRRRRDLISLRPQDAIPDEVSNSSVKSRQVRVQLTDGDPRSCPSIPRSTAEIDRFHPITITDRPLLWTAVGPGAAPLPVQCSSSSICASFQG